MTETYLEALSERLDEAREALEGWEGDQNADHLMGVRGEMERLEMVVEYLVQRSLRRFGV